MKELNILNFSSTGTRVKSTLNELLIAAMPKTKFSFVFDTTIRKTKDLLSGEDVNEYTLKLTEPISMQSAREIAFSNERGLFYVTHTTEAIIRENVLKKMSEYGSFTFNKDGTLTYEGLASEVFFDVTPGGRMLMFFPDAPRLIVTDISMANMSKILIDNARAKQLNEKNDSEKIKVIIDNCLATLVERKTELTKNESKVAQIQKIKFSFSFDSEVTQTTEGNLYNLNLTEKVSKQSTLIDSETGLPYFVKDQTKAIVRENVLEKMSNCGSFSKNECGTITFEGPASEVFFDVTQGGRKWVDKQGWISIPDHLIITDISMSDRAKINKAKFDISMAIRRYLTL